MIHNLFHFLLTFLIIYEFPKESEKIRLTDIEEMLIKIVHTTESEMFYGVDFKIVTRTGCLSHMPDLVEVCPTG